MEMLEEEQPPEEIWHHHERITEWFAAIRQRRQNPDMVPIEESDESDNPLMIRNELVSELIGEPGGSG